MKPILGISLSLVFLLLSTVSLASPKDPIRMDNHSGKVTPKGFMQKYKRGQIPQAQQGITPPDNTTSRTPSGTHSTGNGTLLWEDHYDREGDLLDWASKVAVKGDKVFAVGGTQTTIGGNAFSIRVYNAINGMLLWQDHYDREGDLDDTAETVAVNGNRVFVGGWTQTTVGGYALSVRAYNATNGTLLWENHYDREGNLEDWAEAVAVRGNTVFVAGTTQTTTSGYAFSVWAYNATNGTLLWENHYDREGNLWDWAADVAVRGNTVFVAGTTRTTTGGDAFTVRAHNTVNGTVLWQDNYDREGNLEDMTLSVAVSGSTVCVVGRTWTTTGGSAFSVRAYNATNGTLQWENHYDRDTEATRTDRAYSVAVGANRAFVTGKTWTSAGNFAFSVRAYNASNGTLLWQDHYDREGNLDEGANCVAVHGNKVFVGGWTQTTAGDWAFSIRAYDAANGTLLWENHYDREGALWDWANGIAVDDTGVFVGGITATSSGGYAFSVRAFEQ